MTDSNGQNLMFCADAARSLHVALRVQPAITAFQLQVTPMESHDAVALSWYG